MVKHIVQTPEWAEFKTKYGTPAVQSGNVVYTTHKIPFTSNYFAYCPRINPSEVNFNELKDSLNEHSCVSINFDVPNIIVNTPEEAHALDIFGNHECEKSPRDQFAKSNILMDITPNENILLSAMHTKHRYNIQYAMKKGVEIKKAESEKDFEDFYLLFAQTASRQKYYIRPKEYYKILWNMFNPKGMSEILTAYHEKKPLASWMFLLHENIIYYPYGGSSEDSKNLHASNLVAWEGIKLGKERNCTTFDMWGASDDIENKEDPWWGFTNFKLKFGGKYIKYMDSYDMILNDPIYKMFNFANSVRWKLLKVLA